MNKKILNSLRIAKEILLAKYMHKMLPVSIKVFITDKCNLNCDYCYPLIHKREFGMDMTKEELFKLFDDLASLGTKVIVLQGGEPLLRKDVGEIIDYVLGKGMICEMISNGFLVPEKINEVKKLNSLCISIDGTEEENDFYRGRGSYKKAMEAIRICMREKIPIRLHSVITRRNMDSFYVFELAKELGVGITVSTITTNEFSGIKYDPKMCLTQDETKKFWAKVHEYKKRGVPINFSNSTLLYFINYPFEDFNEVIRKNDPRLAKLGKERKKFCYCTRKYLSPEVLADATIYPCSKLMHSPHAPNLRKVGLKEALKILASNDCVTCGSITDFELNALLNLNFSTVFEVLKYYLGKMK